MTAEHLRLRCFVAMAVGRTDTDRIYDKHILPTLRAQGITATFMGRLEHNDDVDKRIMREIEACDFVIADLTYARPSVYFEAGYAQRKVPVVYTCRADHLGQGNGELRVHFDLLMRSIVSWSSQVDGRFATKLAKRIKIVVRPLIRQRQSDARAKIEIAEFQRRSVFNRINFTAEIIVRLLESCGYKSLAVKENFLAYPWVGRIPKRNVLNLCSASVEPTFTQRAVRDYVSEALELAKSRFESFLEDFEGYNKQRWQYRWDRFKVPKAIETKYADRIIVRLILCSLEKIPSGRLASAVPHFTAIVTGQLYSFETAVFMSDQKSLPCSVYIHIVAPVLSGPDAATKSEELKRIIKQTRKED